MLASKVGGMAGKSGNIWSLVSDALAADGREVGCGVDKTGRAPVWV